MSHPEDRAWYWQAAGRSLGDTPPALPPYPGVGGPTTKASLQFPSPNCFLPRVGTRNSRLPLLCLSRVSARAGKGCSGRLGGAGHSHSDGHLGCRPRGSHGSDTGLSFVFFLNPGPSTLQALGDSKRPRGWSVLLFCIIGWYRGSRPQIWGMGVGRPAWGLRADSRPEPDAKIPTHLWGGRSGGRAVWRPLNQSVYPGTRLRQLLLNAFHAGQA